VVAPSSLRCFQVGLLDEVGRITAGRSTQSDRPFRFRSRPKDSLALQWLGRGVSGHVGWRAAGGSATLSSGVCKVWSCPGGIGLALTAASCPSDLRRTATAAWPRTASASVSCRGGGRRAAGPERHHRRSDVQQILRRPTHPRPRRCAVSPPATRAPPGAARSSRATRARYPRKRVVVGATGRRPPQLSPSGHLNRALQTS
jgi:hypothetical protein